MVCDCCISWSYSHVFRLFDFVLITLSHGDTGRLVLKPLYFYFFISTHDVLFSST